MNGKVLFAIAAVLLLATPLAAAHPRATVVKVAGERCYIFSADTDTPELWIETNGVIHGGEMAGTPVDHATGQSSGGSGLQRTAGDHGPADTRVDPVTFAERCFV